MSKEEEEETGEKVTDDEKEEREIRTGFCHVCGKTGVETVKSKVSSGHVCMGCDEKQRKSQAEIKKRLEELSAPAEEELVSHKDKTDDIEDPMLTRVFGLDEERMDVLAIEIYKLVEECDNKTKLVIERALETYEGAELACVMRMIGVVETHSEIRDNEEYRRGRHLELAERNHRINQEYLEFSKRRTVALEKIANDGIVVRKAGIKSKERHRRENDDKELQGVSRTELKGVFDGIGRKSE